MLSLPSAGGLRRRALRAVAVLAAAGSMAFAPGLPAQTPATGGDRRCRFPPLSAHVTDLTQTLSSAEKQALEAKLADWEARTTNQLAVLIVPTTQPEPIEALFDPRRRGMEDRPQGQRQRRAVPRRKNDRKMRIEVGYGLEGALTDVTSRRIIAENVAPLFREGKFAAGIDAGVDSDHRRRRRRQAAAAARRRATASGLPAAASISARC